MKNEIIIAGKELTEPVVTKLDDALTRGNVTDLKKQMEKLFTFKNICNMHDDHITELAECITDLWASEDKVEWAETTESYLRGRISKYQRRKSEWRHKMTWAKKTDEMDEVEMLDLTYRLWVYEHGFEYSHFQMYSMLHRIARNVLQSEGEL